MQKDVFLVGMGQTRFGEWWNQSLRDLVDEAVTAAMETSPCTALDIDAVVVANMLGESLSGQAQLGAMTSALLPHRPPALRVEAACGSGGIAIHTACALLESGRASTVLVVGAEKMTDATSADVAAALMGAADAELDATCGLTFPGIFGIIARRYMHDYGLTRQELNLVSSVHHHHARDNPFAQFRSPITPEAVGASALVADPLRLLDCSPVSDGAAAVLLSTQFPSDILLRASQIAADTLSLTDRMSITSFAATKDAALRAYAEASAEPDDMDCLEIHDCFSIAALIALEDLGLAAPGEGITLYAHSTERCINRSGGLKACGHPVAATGVKQIVDVAKQLRAGGKCLGLAQNFGGAGVTCAVHILEHRPR